MSNQVQRLRFFDGEYLRSNDFTDEQSYHVEMRRRLNHRLHLHGIVYGLHIVPDQDSVPPDAIFYSISPGMAIDRTGKEIFVSAPYSLSSSDVLNQPALQAAEYGVWICYQETQTGLPAAGYRDCHATDQQTRWQESFKVVLMPVVGASTVPDCGGICLGTVKLVYNNGWQISTSFTPTTKFRAYVGIRAQRVIAPDEEQDTFDMTAQNVDPTNRIALPGYLDVQPSALERGNLIVEKNVVIGDDFILDASVNKNLPKSIPGTGNLKITSDLFLNGDFYGYSTSDGVWYSLKQYIQSLTSKFVVGPPIIIPAPSPTTANPQPPNSSSAISGQFAAFPTGSPPQVLLAITEMDWQDPKTLQNWPIGTPITVSVSNPAITSAAPGFNTLSVQWTASPVVAVGGKWLFPVTNLVVGFVVIYQP